MLHGRREPSKSFLKKLQKVGISFCKRLQKDSVRSLESFAAKVFAKVLQKFMGHFVHPSCSVSFTFAG
jgi:hypothetical protein